jgi:NAD(P)-dependent dehydrogenase (short-subunit alcohol dehydrogenase family)
MTTFDYTDKVVLITGAASGFGRLAAAAFAEAGALLALADLNLDALNTTVGDAGIAPERVLAMRCDVAVNSEVQQLVAATVTRFGRLDVAINNAGIGHPLARLEDCDEESFDRNIAVNLKGVFLCLRAELPQMVRQGGGVILNVSSVAGIAGAPMLGPYAAAKHGVIGLTKTAALEYARRNIRVNALCPGYTHTPLLDTLRSRPGTLEHMAAAIPMQRLGNPEEIVQAMLWACSPQNSFMTGQAIALDGGLTAA